MTRRRSLDAGTDFWDNGYTVIKPLALAVVLALSIAGCQKSADLGRVQEESLELVKVHVKVIDQLQRRADKLLERGRSISTRGAAANQGIADAGRILTDARAQLDQLRALTVQAPSAIAATAKTGSDEEMYKTIDELVAKLEDGATLVRAALDAVDQWLAYAESRPTPAAAANQPPPAAPPASPVSPASPASPSAAPAAGAGSAAPATPQTP